MVYNEIGTLLGGVLFNTFLYAIVVYQFILYHQLKFEDGPVIKYMVLLLFLLDTFHSISVIYMAWNYIVSNNNNPMALAVIGWPYAFTPLGTALAALITHTFQGHRIWRLTGKGYLCGIVILLAVPSFILGMICRVQTWIFNVFSELPRVSKLVAVWLSMQTLTDTLVTVTQILVFAFYRSQSRFPRTDAVLDRLAYCAVQTGLPAGLLCVAELLAFAVSPDSHFYHVFVIPTGRIYTNAVLYTLLIRRSIRAEYVGTYDLDLVDAISLHVAPIAGSQSGGSIDEDFVQGARYSEDV